MFRRPEVTDRTAVLPRNCPICHDPSDYHCGDLGCMGECGCNLTATQVERLSADA